PGLCAAMLGCGPIVVGDATSGGPGGPGGSGGQGCSQGQGLFAPPVTYPVGARPSAVSAADLDGDGRVDLAVANAYGGTLSVLLNKGDSTLAISTYADQGYATRALAAADMNGDGWPDLAVAYEDDTNKQTGQVGVLLGTGKGTFQPASRYGLPA